MYEIWEKQIPNIINNVATGIIATAVYDKVKNKNNVQIFIRGTFFCNRKLKLQAHQKTCS